MPRCIDADLAINDLCGSQCGCTINECGLEEPCEKARCILKQPTADVQEVKHGRWIMVRKTMLIPTGYMAVVEGHVLTKTGADKPFTMQEANIIPLKAHKIVKIPYCSVCGNYGDDEYDKTPYCPICGAKMDGDNNGKDNSC